MTKAKPSRGFSPEAFVKRAQRHFAFLEKFGFRRRKPTADAGVYWVEFVGPVTTVIVGLEWNEQYLFVELRNSNAPSQADVAFHLEDLLTLRAPGEKQGPPYANRPLSMEATDRILRSYSMSLRKHATDFLAGDWSDFPAINVLMERRVREFESQQ
ncbi:MAG TPA: hypothetical protein VHM30_03645 [Gemmatimonadaceae bacterium]|nr:hypothetical protein [Gemmatimonadaceae bacterium]HEX2778568.1 hypothetical protein [Gemmatimonadaceae bacterium]